MKTNEDIIELLKREIKDTKNGLSPANTKLASMPIWDSLVILLIIDMVESEFGIFLTGQELRACKTVADIAKLVNSKR